MTSAFEAFQKRLFKMAAADIPSRFGRRKATSSGPDTVSPPEAAETARSSTELAEQIVAAGAKRRGESAPEMTRHRTTAPQIITASQIIAAGEKRRGEVAETTAMDDTARGIINAGRKRRGEPPL